uniref:Uncharacterized protein n=1 Tax=Glossina pallidipes TaxID=7398 RepID=A0A1A9ZRS0_GLOPL
MDIETQFLIQSEFNRNGILSCEAHEYECTTTTTATNSECNENAKGAAKGYRLISCFLAGELENSNCRLEFVPNLARVLLALSQFSLRYVPSTQPITVTEAFKQSSNWSRSCLYFHLQCIPSNEDLL